MKMDDGIKASNETLTDIALADVSYGHECDEEVWSDSF